MNKINLRKIIYITIPSAVLLIFYMVIMGITGENAKILAKSKDFLKTLLEHNHIKAFEMLTKEYQKEFFNEPMIFFYAIQSSKDLCSAIYSVNKDKPEMNSSSDSGVLDGVVDLDTKGKKLFFIKRGFPYFPWQRGNSLYTFFTIPSETQKRFEQFFVQLFNLYSDTLLEQFKNHIIILEKEGNMWKISNIIINDKKVDNIFLRKDYPDLSKDFTFDYMELEDQKVIAEKLEENKVDKKNIEAFYQIILKNSSQLRDYIDSIEKKGK
ncbi:hypothetical protein KKB18_00855 [bacterium]|nr:hypothetical protein [bacterium]